MNKRPLIRLAVLGGATLLAAACDQPAPRQGDDGGAVRAMLGGSADAAEGFARVRRGDTLTFPRDHGPHPAYRSEWWYYTGNLETDAGRRFGFELTFFRFALRPDPVEAESAFATRQAWMAHFAVTDVAAGRHHAFERFQRGALGLAGARATPFRVWLDDWRVEAVDSSGGLFPARLVAGAEGVQLELRLAPGKPRVLQGEEGYSRKGRDPANASHYYSYTRIPARGSVVTPAGRFTVHGSAWLDREWSTSALDDNQVGWDWFALQLDDGRDLMLYRLRRADGGTDPNSAGVLVGADGRAAHFGAGEFRLEALRRWQSPTSGASYPVEWRVAVPGHDLDLVVEPQLDGQEMDLRFSYWEGAVRVRAGDGSSRATGRGYMELVGYADER